MYIIFALLTLKIIVMKCYALSKDGTLRGCHCPLSKEKKSLESTFNFQVRGEYIMELDVDESFVCRDKGSNKRCSICPFY